jgi:hypothetical protein
MAGNGGAAGSMMHVVERRELTSGARRSARGERRRRERKAQPKEKKCIFKKTPLACGLDMSSERSSGPQGRNWLAQWTGSVGPDSGINQMGI